MQSAKADFAIFQRRIHSLGRELANLIRTPPRLNRSGPGSAIPYALCRGLDSLCPPGTAVAGYSLFPIPYSLPAVPCPLYPVPRSSPP
jgi:hypothetical protein